MILRVSPRQKAWGLAVGWVCSIWLSVGYVLVLDSWLRRWPFYSHLVSFVCVLLIVAGIVYLLPRRSWSLWQIGAAAIIFSLYAVTLWQLNVPAERVHLPQYGLCVLLFYRALRLDTPFVMAVSLSWVLATLAGFSDELLQGRVPGRFFGWNDVLVNAWAAALAASLILTSNCRSSKML